VEHLVCSDDRTNVRVAPNPGGVEERNRPPCSWLGAVLVKRGFHTEDTPTRLDKLARIDFVYVKASRPQLSCRTDGTPLDDHMFAENSCGVAGHELPSLRLVNVLLICDRST
jgi:hypothetical protein